MKSIAITKATRALADYARAARKGTLVVTKRGKPMAAVVPLRGVDLESLLVSTHPDFVALIAAARARFAKTGGVSLEEIKRRWRVGPHKASRRANATTIGRQSRRGSGRSR